MSIKNLKNSLSDSIANVGGNFHQGDKINKKKVVIINFQNTIWAILVFLILIFFLTYSYESILSAIRTNTQESSNLKKIKNDRIYTNNPKESTSQTIVDTILKLKPKVVPIRKSEYNIEVDDNLQVNIPSCLITELKKVSTVVVGKVKDFNIKIKVTKLESIRQIDLKYNVYKYECGEIFLEINDHPPLYTGITINSQNDNTYLNTIELISDEVETKLKSNCEEIINKLLKHVSYK